MWQCDPRSLVGALVLLVGMASLVGWLASATEPGRPAIAGKYRSPDEAAYFKRIDVDRPGLDAVREAVRREDYSAAKRAYFRWREEGEGRPRFFFEGRDPILRESVRSGFAAHSDEAMTVARHLLRGTLWFEGQAYSLSDPPSYFPRRPGRVVSRLARLLGWNPASHRVLEDILLNSFQVAAGSLGTAYLTTGDERFATKFCELVAAWRESASPLPDPYLAGDLTHPQAYYLFTVAARASAWLHGSHLIQGAECADTKFRFDVLRELVAHVDYVNDSLTDALQGRGVAVNLKFWRRPHNQPFVTAARQAAVLIMLPELRDRAAMLANALQYLDYYLTTHVTAEGHQAERDSTYHMGTFVYVAELALLARLNDVPLPSRVLAQLEASFDVMLKIVQPNGFMPAIGNTELSMDAGSHFALGAMLFQRPDLAALAGEHLDWPTYLATHRFAEERRILAEPGDVSLGSMPLPSTGFYVMRSGIAISPRKRSPDGREDGLYLLFDLAPSLGHTHRDALNIIVSGYGSTPPYNLLDESGVGRNWAVNRWTPYYFSARAHNVLIIDRMPPPSWTGDPPPRLQRWVSTEAFDFVAGGYGAAYRGNTVTRNILFVKGDYWVLRDDVRGHTRHLLEQVFNFAPIVTWDARGHRRVKARYRLAADTKAFQTDYLGPNLIVMPTGSEHVRARVERGRKAHPSLAARATEPSDVASPTLVYSASIDTSKGAAMEALLYPVPRGEHRRIEVAPLGVEPTSGAAGTRVTIAGPTSERVDYHLRGDGARTGRYGNAILFRGRQAFVRTRPGGDVDRICIVDGEEIAYRTLRLRVRAGGSACVTSEGPNAYEVLASGPVDIAAPTDAAGQRPRIRYRRPWVQVLSGEAVAVPTATTQ